MRLRLSDNPILMYLIFGALLAAMGFLALRDRLVAPDFKCSARPEREGRPITYTECERAGTTVEDRRRNLTGFVYSPVRVGDFIGSVLERNDPYIKIAIYDGEGVDFGLFAAGGGGDA